MSNAAEDKKSLLRITWHTQEGFVVVKEIESERPIYVRKISNKSDEELNQIITDAEFIVNACNSYSENKRKADLCEEALILLRHMKQCGHLVDMPAHIQKAASEAIAKYSEDK